MFATLDDVKTAVRAGNRVFWKNARYEVQRHVGNRTGAEQWLICCDGSSWVGMHPSEYAPSDFFTE